MDQCNNVGTVQSLNTKAHTNVSYRIKPQTHSWQQVGTKQSMDSIDTHQLKTHQSTYRNEAYGQYHSNIKINIYNVHFKMTCMTTGCCLSCN